MEDNSGRAERKGLPGGRKEPIKKGKKGDGEDVVTKGRKKDKP